MFRNALAKPAEQALGMIAGRQAIDGFYLAGGTAAALQLGHRISIDLDFFSRDTFKPDELRRRLTADGVGFEREQASPGTLKVWIAGAEASFFHYPYPLLEPTLPCDGMAMASLVDIGLMKMTAIADRGARRDFVDLFFILRRLGRSHLFDLFVQKYPKEKIDLYHFVRSLTYFVDAEREPEPVMLIPADWQEIKAFFVLSARKVGIA